MVKKAKKVTKQGARKATKSSTIAGKKRSLARRYNDALAVGAGSKTLDRRTARRLNRYKAELKASKTGNKPLTPLDIADRVNALLEHNVKLTEIRKLIKPREVDFDIKHVVALLNEMHPIYGYHPDAYRFAGISNEALLAAGIIDKIPAKRGPKPKKKAGRRSS